MCSPHFEGTEHENTKHQNTSEASVTVTTRISTESVPFHETSQQPGLGQVAALIYRSLETRLNEFSLPATKSLMRYLAGSSSSLPFMTHLT
jgi:hypothetical protein